MCDTIPEQVTKVNMIPEVLYLLDHFRYSYLPGPIHELSNHFHLIAYFLANSLENSPEKIVCLRNLLGAKDSAIRANKFVMLEVERE